LVKFTNIKLILFNTKLSKDIINLIYKLLFH